MLISQIEERIEEISPIGSPTNSGATFESRSSLSDDNEGSHLSDYLQKHEVRLPDLSTDEELQSLVSNGTDTTWEDNWVLKTKKFKADASGSVGMLVPSPTEEVKALIGDKNADEVSDLSEAEGSDVEDGQSESTSTDEGIAGDIPNVLVQNKRIIGGKHNLDSFEDLKQTPDVVESPLSISTSSDSAVGVAEAKNETILIEHDFVKVDNPSATATTTSTNDTQFDTLKKGIIDLIENEAINSVVIEKKTSAIETDRAVDEETVTVEDKTVPIPAPRKGSKGDITIVTPSTGTTTTSSATAVDNTPPKSGNV